MIHRCCRRKINDRIIIITIIITITISTILRRSGDDSVFIFIFISISIIGVHAIIVGTESNFQIIGIIGTVVSEDCSHDHHHNGRQHKRQWRQSQNI